MRYTIKFTLNEYCKKYNLSPEEDKDGITLNWQNDWVPTNFDRLYDYADIVVDCANVPNKINLLFDDKINISGYYTWTFQNCHHCSIWLSYYDTHTTSPFITIKGSNNKIGASQLTFCKVIGDYNDIYATKTRFGIFGSYNHIYAAQDGSIYLNKNSSKNICKGSHPSAYVNVEKECIDNIIITKGQMRAVNESNSTDIFAFDMSVCHTVPTKNMKSYGHSVIKIYDKTNIDCKEPIDEKSGYFYKVVNKDLTAQYHSWGSKEEIPCQYKIGEWVYPDSFDESDTVCSHGLHFFGTIPEVINYNAGIKSNEVILKLKVNFEDIAPIPTSIEDAGENKRRARKVFVEGIVPVSEYEEFNKLFFTNTLEN